MDFFQAIYGSADGAEQYDRLVSREDQRGNLMAALGEIDGLAGGRVVEMGAGTGRLTRLLTFLAGQVVAFDAAPAMLAVAARQLEQTGMANYTLALADHRALPLPDHSADVTVQGWSFGHAVGWYPDRWSDEIERMLAEMRRVTRPGGMIVLFETLGTGNRQPQPPTPELAALYDRWQTQYGLAHRWIRTDYQFETVDEAESLVRFFFGDALADRVRRENLTILPECTGIWWGRLV